MFHEQVTPNRVIIPMTTRKQTQPSVPAGPKTPTPKAPLLRTRTSKSPNLPKIPDLDKNTVLMCYLGMPTIKVVRALKLPKFVCAKVDSAYNQFSEVYVPLVSGPYGTFWYCSTKGLFFELIHPDVYTAVLSLVEPLKILGAVNNRIDLHLHLTVGTKHLPKKTQATQALLEVLKNDASWKALEIR